MLRRFQGMGVLLVAAVLAWACWPRAGRTDPAPTAGQPAPAESAAEKTRRALEQVIDLRVTDESLVDLADRLQGRTGVRFFVDPTAASALQLKLDGPGSPLGLLAAPADSEAGRPKSTKLRPGLRCDLRRVPLRTGLTILLDHYGLGYAILGDTVVLTTAAGSARRQLSQPIDVDLKGVTLARALQELARRTATEVVLDRRAAERGEGKITLRLEDAPLQQAVSLAAAMAGLKVVAQRKILFVTTAEAAKGLRAEAAEQKSTDLKSPGLNPGGDGDGKGGLGGLGGGFGGLGGGFGGLGGGGLGGGGLGGGLGGLGGGLGGLGGGGLGGFAIARPVDPGPAPRLGGASPATAAGDKEKPAKKVEVPAPKAGGAKKPAQASAQILQQLAEPIEVKEPVLTLPHKLREVLQYLHEAKGFPALVVDQAAFRADLPDAPDINETQVALPRLKGVSRDRILRLLLDQVPGGPGYRMAYLLRRGYVEITTAEGAAPERQVVRAAFANRPLEEALEELSEQTGINIVLDGRASEKGRTPVTAAFRSETNLLNAVRLLADMADLRMMVVDNVLYVTLRGNAAEFPPAGMKRDQGAAQGAAQ